MRALAALCLGTLALLSAATKIDDPKTFVTEVFKGYMARSRYTAPEDVYTARLAKLLHDDRRKSKGEAGCVDFVFWLNAQDWKITQLAITSEDQGAERKEVIARFRNSGEPQEMHYDFRLDGGRWLLDDVRSKSSPPWTLSELLKCAQ